MTRASTGAGTRARPTRRQRELLERLVALFLADGFAHLTIEEMAVALRCSKSTLYALAPSKEQLAVTVVRHWFAVAAARVEAETGAVPDVPERIGRYLAVIGEQMRSASAAFLDDMAAFPPTREIYDRNTRAAADRVRGLVDAGIAAGVFRSVRADFVAEMVGATVAAIQRGDVRGRTGMSDAEAFGELSTFVLEALRSHRTPPGVALLE